MKAYYKNEISKIIIGDAEDYNVGMQGINGTQFELRWDREIKRLILWTDGDLIIKCKSGVGEVI